MEDAIGVCCILYVLLLTTPVPGATSLGLKFLRTFKYSERIYPMILKAVVSAEERSSKNKAEWKKVT